MSQCFSKKYNTKFTHLFRWDFDIRYLLSKLFMTVMLPGAGWALAHPEFVVSVSPIPTKGRGRLYPPHYCLPNWIWKSSSSSGCDSASGWAEWALAHPEFAVSDNPIPTKGEGADFAHRITACPPKFENLAASLNECVLYTCAVVWVIRPVFFSYFVYS